MPAPKATASARGQGGVFSSLAVLGLVLAAVVSGVLFLALTAYAPDLRNPTDGGAHALSDSAVGYTGVLDLLRAEGMAATVSRSLEPQREGRQAVLVFTPPPFGSAKPLQAYAARGKVNRDLVLVVLPKWTTTPDPTHSGWVSKVGLLPPGALTEGVLRILTGQAWSAGHGASRPPNGDSSKASVVMPTDLTPFLVRRAGSSRPILAGGGAFFDARTRIPLGAVDSFQTFSQLPPGWSPALVDEQGQTVLAAQTDKNLYVLSDPDLLNNWGLAQRENAQAATSMLNALRSYDQPIVFDATMNGFVRSRDILRLALEPPFLSVTLCLAAAALLMGLHAAVRFGAPRPSPRAFAMGKRALAENSAALIRVAGREPAMARRYAAVLRDLVGRQVGAPRSLDPSELADLLDRIGRSRRVGAPFSSLAREAQAVRDLAGLMASVRNLNHWRREMTRGHS